MIFHTRTNPKQIAFALYLLTKPNQTIMKTSLKFLLVTWILSAGLGAYAQYNIIVFAPKGDKFTLYLGGVQKNSTPANRVETENPGGPSFKLRITFPDAVVKELNKFTFNKAGSNIYFKLDKSTKGVYSLEETESEYMDQGVVKDGSATPPPAPAVGRDGEKKDQPKSGSKPGCDQPMSDPDFNAQLVGISTAPFEPIRLNAAKKAAENHCFSANQIKMVMYVFDSESSRLSFAKYAYDFAYNKEDYAEVNDALHSNRSKDELTKFIADKKK